jgi:hypothetical protein
VRKPARKNITRSSLFSSYPERTIENRFECAYAALRALMKKPLNGSAGFPACGFWGLSSPQSMPSIQKQRLEMPVEEIARHISRN